MKIGQRAVTRGGEPYVIAELGVNHDGSVDRALLLVDAAAEAGCDAVKLQLFEADLLMSGASRLAAYQERAGESDPREMLRRLQLSVHQMGPVVKRARLRGLHAIVTVFSVELVQRAELLDWDAYKTASPDVVHRPLLERLAVTGRPMIVSTGAATADEVRRAVGWLQAAGAADRLALLQCVSSYPVHVREASVEAMGELGEIFHGPIGYSDHTSGEPTASRAVLMGAAVLEKHLTLDRTLAGPDHAASLEPDGLRRYVRAARRAWRLRQENAEYAGKIAAILAGPRGRKRVLDCELDVRSASRQSIVAARALAAGQTITSDDLTFMRPGTGLEPWRTPEVIGRHAARAIDAGELIALADLAAPPTQGAGR